MEKPTKIEAGQRWSWCGTEYVLFDQYPDGDWKGRTKDGKSGAFDRHMLASPSATFLGGPASPERPVDWAKWLPPRELPRNPYIVFKAGQIWAVRWDKVDHAAVFRVAKNTACACATPDNHHIQVEFLAGRRTGGGGYSNRDYTERAVLVADVGCEPTPPEILYGTGVQTPPAPPLTLKEADDAVIARLRARVAELEKANQGLEAVCARQHKINESLATKVHATLPGTDTGKPAHWVPSCDIDCDIPDAPGVLR